MRTLRPARRRAGLLALSALCFVGLYLARVDSVAIGDGLELMLVAPIAILAFEFGLRGGLLGAFVAIATGAVWQAATPGDFDVVAEVARGLAFVVLGAGIGRVADLRTQLQNELVHASDMSLHMIATAGLDGVFQSLNPAWERVLGVPRATLLQRSFIDLVHPDDVDATVAAAQRAMRIDDVVNFRNRCRAGDGSYRWLEWNAHVEEGQSVIYATARDITFEKQAEELLAAHAEILECQVVERTDDLDRARLGTLRRLAFAAELRDDETRHHTDRVGRTSALIAIELGLPRDFVSQIAQAAPVHDVGKLGICDAILLKPGRLTGSEIIEMRTHAQTGHAILSGSDCPVLQLAAAISLTHHERWDGAGYPNGLKGDEIPLAGRIVALADVFDALSHARPYKAAWSIARVLATIDEGAGMHFDPQVVAAFQRLDPIALLDDPVCADPTVISELREPAAGSA